MTPTRGREIALLVSIPLVAFLVLAEVGLRLYLRNHIFYDVEMSRYARSLKVDSRNPSIGHRHRPGGHERLMGADVRINSSGFRDDEYPLEKGDRWRIILLGDSLTFGWGVEKEETFEHRLEETLHSRSPTEIINFGHGNYNTEQEVHLFLDEGLAYDPDQVVLFYFINDAEPVPQPSRFAWLGSIRIATFYWSRVKALVANVSDSTGFEEYYSTLYREGAEGWRRSQEAFLELARVCEKNDIVLQVVLLPELHELRGYAFAREHALVTEFLGSQDIPVLDLAPSFADQPDPHALWVSTDDAHPNAEAHRLIADYSVDFIAGGRRPDA